MQRDKGENFCLDNEARGRTEANARAYLDGGVDGVADDAGVGLPGAEPDRGDLGASVEHEVPRHRRLSQSLCYWALSHGGLGNAEERSTGREAAVVAGKEEGVVPI